jgi:UDP-N-acetylglucosamine 1-carboxyvinyltransferase
MEKFIIRGGYPLNGEILPSGNKNAALPMLAACLLTDEPVILHNLPDIKDVETMRMLLESLGVQINALNNNTWRVHASQVRPADLDPDICRKIRASILLAGPMVARTGELKLPPPGGDVIGRRRVDSHILALRSLGAEAKYDRSQKAFTFSATQLSASEPHIQELCQFLNILGAKIKNIGSNTLHISGVSKLHGGEFSIGPDYLEVVSYIGAAVVTKGSIRIRNSAPRYLDMIAYVFRRLGVEWTVDGEDIVVPEDQELTVEPDLGGAIPEISVMPWPAFPTDLMSIAIVVATQSKGSVLFHDWMYPSRMFFIDKLVNMGAQIVLCDPHRSIVQGPTVLYGEMMESPDIRAGMSMVLAALAAQGESVIRNVGQIDRGYESVDKKLRALGARIERVAD